MQREARVVDVGGFSFTVHVRPPAAPADEASAPAGPTSNADDLTGWELWPGALHLARCLAQRRRLVSTRNVLELGAGAGVPGMLAARLGAPRVVLSDLPQVLPELQRNIQTNGLASSCSTAVLDWNHPPPPDHAHAYDLVLAADVLFLSRDAPKLAATVLGVTAKHGIVLLGHQLRRSVYLDRSTGQIVRDATDEPYEAFVAALSREAFAYQLVARCPGAEGGDDGIVMAFCRSAEALDDALTA